MSRVLRFPLRHTALRLLVRSSWSRLSLEEIAARFGSPDRVNDFMQVCFDYVGDDEHHGIADHWQDPRHTLELLRGDCEDYAVFAWHVLRMAGQEASVLCTFTEREGHALCVALEETASRRHAVTLCNEGLRRVPLPRRAKGLCPVAAEHVSSAVYPGRWQQCSWVAPHRLEALVAGPIERPFDPGYAWVRANAPREVSR